MTPQPTHQNDRRAPYRKTAERLEIEDADRKPKLRDRIKRFFKRRHADRRRPLP